MTAKETERLAKVEQKVDDLKESTDRGFKAINDKLDAALNRMDIKSDSFVTMAQAKLTAWGIGLVISLATIAIMLWNHFTK